LHRQVQVGVEYNPAAGEFAPLATCFIRTESDRMPAVFVGTSSDRIGSPEGTQAYYATVAKFLPRAPVGVYASLAYSEWDAGWNAPFGAQWEVGRGAYVRAMYDGERTHLLAGRSMGRFDAALVWAWLERLGGSVAVGF
jgi:hypothetical protein